jgi:hypothetical protein
MIRGRVLSVVAFLAGVPILSAACSAFHEPLEAAQPTPATSEAAPRLAEETLPPETRSELPQESASSLESAGSSVPVPAPRIRLRVEREGEPPRAGDRICVLEWRVHDPTAAISIASSRARAGDVPQTDDAATCEFTVEPGLDHSVWLEGEPEPDIKWMRIPAVAPGEVREVDLRVPELREVVYWGCLVDADTGKPIRGKIECEAPLELVQTPDAQGCFCVRGRVRDTHTVVANASGYSPHHLALRSGFETREVAKRVELVRSATVEVVVVDGAPLRRCQVRLVGGHTFHNPTGWDGRTDKNGRVRISGLPARTELTLEALAPDREVWIPSATVDLEPGEVRKLELDLGKSGAIHGVVLDEHGSPVGDLRLIRARRVAYGLDASAESANWRRAVTSAEGTFRFDDVEPGTWWIGIEPPLPFVEPREPSPVALQFESTAVAPGQDIELVLRASRDLAIEGKVVDPDFRPVAGVSVQAASGSSRGPSAVSDAKGKFVLGPLLGGEWTIYAQPERPYLAPEPLEQVAAGSKDLVVLVDGTGTTIRGTILDARGWPSFRTCEVRCVNLGSVMESIGFTRDGRFELTCLEPGRYAIVADDFDLGVAFCMLDVEARKPPPPVELVLERGARLEVRNEGHEGYHRVRVRRGDIVLGMLCVSARDSDSLVVPPGDLDLDLWRDGEFVRHGSITATVSREVELALKP